MNWQSQLPGMKRAERILRSPHPRVLRKGNPLCTLSYPIQNQGEMPRGFSLLEETAAWQKEKKPGWEPGYLGPCSSFATACVGWPLSSGPHGPVHTARWPESPATLFSPLWMVSKPAWGSPAAQRPAAAPLRVSTFQELISACTGRLLDRRPLSTLPALSPGQPQARDAIFQAEASRPWSLQFSLFPATVWNNPCPQPKNVQR